MTSEKPTVAFALSLIAGILIMLRGGIMSMMGLWFGGYQGQYPYYGGMMGGYNGYGNGYGGYGWMYSMMNGNGYYGMMRGLGIGFGYMGLFGLVFGLVVIASALTLWSRPNQHATWGTLIVIFSVLSLFGGMMSGLGLGLILGVIGGALAIIWKPGASAPRPGTK